MQLIRNLFLLNLPQLFLSYLLLQNGALYFSDMDALLVGDVLVAEPRQELTMLQV